MGSSYVGYVSSMAVRARSNRIEKYKKISAALAGCLYEMVLMIFILFCVFCCCYEEACNVCIFIPNIDRIFCLAGMTVRDEPAGTGERATAETLSK